jgi:nicotinamide phosphoribosyltransferase
MMRVNIFGNPIVLTDSYKVSHHRQYPPGMTNLYSYWESRGGKFDEVTMFGLQYFLSQYLQVPITMEHIDEAERDFAAHFGDAELFPREGWERIVKIHNGYFPVRIKAVPEGTTVPVRNVLMTVESMDENIPWVANYLETLLSQVWYPTTVTTQSRQIKRMILGYLLKTGDPALIPFKLHDFGFRGVSSVESAALGGGAHLVNFLGTDTMIAYKMLQEFYKEPMAGFSIPAAEHSTISSWGRDGELDAFRNMIHQYGSRPNGAGLYAVVSDTWNIFEACKNWGTILKEEVLGATNGLVVRPDSGDPPVVVLKVLRILGEHFGYTINDKGYKVLNNVRVIQGDGVNIDSIDVILSRMMLDGWSADNIAFGMGGALLQKLNRDTCRFAFKAAEVVVNGTRKPVYKDPVTDPGKGSKSGRMKLIYNDGFYKTFPIGYRTVEEGASTLPDHLHLVYENGHLFNEEPLAVIRDRAEVRGEEAILPDS